MVGGTEHRTVRAKLADFKRKSFLITFSVFIIETHVENKKNVIANRFLWSGEKSTEL